MPSVFYNCSSPIPSLIWVPSEFPLEAGGVPSSTPWALLASQTLCPKEIRKIHLGLKMGAPLNQVVHHGSSWFIKVHHGSSWFIIFLSYSNCHVAVISHFRIGHDRPAWQEADVAWDLRLTPWIFVLGDFPLDAIRIEMSQAWWEVLFLPTTNSFFELREFTTVIVMNSSEMGYDREPPNITWQKQWKTPQNNPDTVSGSAEIGAILGFFHGWDYEANFSYGA